MKLFDKANISSFQPEFTRENAKKLYLLAFELEKVNIAESNRAFELATIFEAAANYYDL